MINIHFPLQKIFNSTDKIVYSLDKSTKSSKLALKEGCFYYFQGKNGAGKTTLLNIISFLTDFDGGVALSDSNLTLNGEGKSKSTKEKSDIRKNHFSYIFQDPHIINIYTIRENLKIVNPKFNFHDDILMISEKVNGLNIKSDEKNIFG